ncbi:MAG: hypothetical protein DDT27_01546 [Dehalococcoidia bacterium]|nr:hypothetical protein [Chloroflexota bacterium]MBT9162979.1 hypothetical protein [Chloroflexota bacterium]
MESCRYRLSKNGSVLSAQDYGYWSLRWSADSMDPSLKRLLSPPFQDLPLISAAKAASFFLSFQLIALYGACYWIYPTLPNFSNAISVEKLTQTMREMKTGRDDAIKDLRYSNGEPYSEQAKTIFSGQFGRFYKAIRDDVEANAIRRRGLIDVNLSRTACTFISSTAAMYKVDRANIDTATELFIASYIDNEVSSHLLALHEFINIES